MSCMHLDAPCKHAGSRGAFCEAVVTVKLGSLQLLGLAAHTSEASGAATGVAR